MTHSNYPLFLFLSVAFLYTAIASARADETGGSNLQTYDYALFVAPARVLSGSTLELSVCSRNAKPICAFQFDLALPDGFTYAGRAKLSTARTTAERTNVFLSNVRSDGNMRVACSTAAGEHGMLYHFSGTEGEVCTIPINIARGVKPGQYAVKLYGCIINRQDSADATHSVIEIKVADTVTTYLTVTGEAFDGIVLDEHATQPLAAADTTAPVQVIKHMPAGRPTTLCLPFELTGDQVADIFGTEVKIGNYTGWDEDYTNEDDENPATIAVHVTLTDPSQGLEANHPYVVWPELTVDTFELGPTYIHPEGDLTVSTGSRRRHDEGSLVGTYETGVVPTAALYFDGDSLCYSYGASSQPAFGAYFVLTDALQAYYDGESAGRCTQRVPVTIYDQHETPVSIHSATTTPTTTDLVYSLDGIVVSRHGLQGLPRGLYIVGGRKVQVR